MYLKSCQIDFYFLRTEYYLYRMGYLENGIFLMYIIYIVRAGFNVINIEGTDDKQVGVRRRFFWRCFQRFSFVYAGHNPGPGAHISYNASPGCFNGVPLVRGEIAMQRAANGNMKIVVQKPTAEDLLYSLCWDNTALQQQRA